MDIWGILGIPPTSDADTIRKVYANQVKACHPEDHPEEFKQLNKAFKLALAAAKYGSVKTEGVSESVDIEGSKQQVSDFDFFDLPQSINKEQGSMDVLYEMRAMIERKEPRLSVWMSFLHSEGFARAMDEPVFIGEFTDYLRQHLFSYKRALFREIQRIYFTDNHRDSSMPPYRQLKEIIERRMPSRKRRLAKLKYIISQSYFALVLIAIVIVVLVMASINR